MNVSDLILGTPSALLLYESAWGKARRRRFEGYSRHDYRFTSDARLFVERNLWELEARDFQGLNDWIDSYLRIKLSDA
jgi:hypothetical protein